MKTNMKENSIMELSLNDMEQANGGWLITVVAISYFAGDNED